PQPIDRGAGPDRWPTLGGGRDQIRPAHAGRAPSRAGAVGPVARRPRRRGRAGREDVPDYGNVKINRAGRVEEKGFRPRRATYLQGKVVPGTYPGTASFSGRALLPFRGVAPQRSLPPPGRKPTGDSSGSSRPAKGPGRPAPRSRPTLAGLPHRVVV